MTKILINYNFTPEKDWIGDDYLIYDRSDDGVDHLKDFEQSKIIKTENVGNVDYDKLSYLIDNYYDLPEVFLWSKSNLFKKLEDDSGEYKFVSPEEYEAVKDNKDFTPILTQKHKTYSDKLGLVNYYSGGMYYERNPLLYSVNGSRYFQTYAEFANNFGFPNPHYIPFAPGGTYILTRERVHRYARDLYIKMASYLPYCSDPLEAHFAERAYYSIWA